MNFKKKKINRRGFLKNTLTIGGGALAVSQADFMTNLVMAQSNNQDAPKRHYIFCYFGGGWDVLLSLDPRDPRAFPSTEENLRRTQIQPAYEQQTRPDADVVRSREGHLFGPYMGELLRHSDKLAVVRGMNMETLSHASGRRRFLTGKAPSGSLARGSNGATWLASHLGKDNLVPNLSLRVESYNRDQPNYATALRVSTVPDLLRALRPADPLLDPLLGRQVDASLKALSNCPDAKLSRAWQKAEYARIQSENLVKGSLSGYFDFTARNDLMDPLRARYQFNRLDNSPAVSAALATQAIISGVSRCVTVNLVGGLDSHSGTAWQQDHGVRQETGFTAVARMVDELASHQYDAESTWLDHTIIVGFSEFSRTPMLNLSGGRDHHLTNSCFLIGGSVRGGQVIGGSSDVAMQSVNVNTRTGRVDPNGEVIRPEHVLRSLYDEVGIGSEPDLRVGPLDTLLHG